MQVDYELIAGILGTILEEAPLIQGAQTHQFGNIVSRLVIGLNNVENIYDQMEFLKEDQARIDAKHIEKTGEIETEMVRLQEQCPHISKSEIDSPTSFRLVTCNICGKIMGEEATGEIQ